MENNQIFGLRLQKLRKLRGLSQAALAKKVETSRRSIGYYECESQYPPAKLLSDLSVALEVSIEELLGTEPIKQDARTVDAKFWPKWQELSGEEKKTVTKLVETLLVAHAG